MIEFGQSLIEFGQSFIEFGQLFIEFGQSFIEFGQWLIEFGESFIEFDRVMDKLFIKGLDTTFLAISLNAVKNCEISLASSHLDSSSFHVDGEYNISLPSVIFQQIA